MSNQSSAEFLLLVACFKCAMHFLCLFLRKCYFFRAIYVIKKSECFTSKPYPGSRFGEEMVDSDYQECLTSFVPARANTQGSQKEKIQFRSLHV